MLVTILMAVNESFGQIKVGDNATQIKKSALLELESTKQGLLLPRLTDTTAINALTPPNGMMIYLNASTVQGLYIRKAGAWQRLSTDSSTISMWSKNGDNLTGSEKLGALNAKTLSLITNGINRLTIDGSSGDVNIPQSIAVADSSTTRRLIVTDSVKFQNLNKNNTGWTEVLVIDTISGQIEKRALSSNAFRNLVAGSFQQSANANGISKITGTNTDSLVLYAAGATTPGAVSATSQTFGGNKTFQDSLTAAKAVLVGTTGNANSTLQVQGSVSYSIRSVTANTTLGAGDYTINVDASSAPVTVTLPAATTAVTGRVYIVKKIAGGLTNDVTINVSGGGAIDDGTSFSIYNDWTVVKFQTDGAKWYIIK